MLWGGQSIHYCVSAVSSVRGGLRPALPKGLRGGPGVDLILFLSGNTSSASVEVCENRQSVWAELQNVQC